MKDNQIIGDGSTVDLSSNEPHITIGCPLCGNSYMKKVELNTVLFTPCECQVQYTLTTAGNEVSVEMTLTKEQTKQFYATR